MTSLKKSEIEQFIKTNEESTLKDYLDRLWDNLDELNKKEEKHSLWLVIVFFLFLVLSNTSVESFNIGPVTFKDISIISKILPLIFIYIFFNLGVISSHKRELNLTIKSISEAVFKQSNSSQTIRDEYSGSFIIRMFLPYSFSNAIMKVFNKKPTIIESLIGFSLLLPVLIIGLIPYVLTIIMLYDLWKNFTTDILGKICFWTTLWAFCLSVFYIVKNGLNNNK